MTLLAKEEKERLIRHISESLDKGVYAFDVVVGGVTVTVRPTGNPALPEIPNVFGVEKLLGGIARCATLKTVSVEHVLVFVGENWRACLVPRKPGELAPSDEVEAKEGGEP